MVGIEVPFQPLGRKRNETEENDRGCHCRPIELQRRLGPSALFARIYLGNSQFM